MEKYILTGGPGVGKTTLLDQLTKIGEITVPEVAREIIFEQKKKENGILPWNNLVLFQGLVIEKQLLQEESLNGSQKRIFLDRGLADNIAFMEVGNVLSPGHLHDMIAQAGYTRVFYLEQLPFYVQDAERKEDTALARKIHDQLYSVYDRLGFDIVTVPACSIEERVQFILKEAHQEKNHEIEKKYRIEHARVKEILQQYVVNHAGVDQEKNILYDFQGLLKNADCVLRIRENNSNGDNQHILTVKGPNKSKQFHNKTEYNIPLPAAVSTFLQAVLPEDLSYSKHRENYHPLGDSSCTISLDFLPALGLEFVEIEAASENQVLLWERRLGLAEYAINKSYPALVKEHEITNSR